METKKDISLSTFGLAIGSFIILTAVSLYGIFMHPEEPNWFNRATLPYTYLLILCMIVCLTVGSINWKYSIALATSGLFISIVGSKIINLGNPLENASYIILIFALMSLGIRFFRTYSGDLDKTVRSYGFQLIHTGTVLILLGAVLSTTLTKEIEQNFFEGRSIEIDGYSIKVDRFDKKITPSLVTEKAYVEIFNREKLVKKGIAELINYRIPNWGYLTHTLIYRSLSMDIHIIFQGTTSFHEKVYAPIKIKMIPFVNFIWIGVFFYIIGAFMSFRTPKEEKIEIDYLLRKTELESLLKEIKILMDEKKISREKYEELSNKYKKELNVVEKKLAR
ncbi:MAG: cytochrome c-type biogenesis CcmF C-terminal domain-containing protein [Candidatus Hydrothermarchaeota archaeon]